MFLLDTNVVSELRKAHSRKVDENFARWSNSLSVDEAFLSAITVMELEMGVLAMERRDPTSGVALRAWMDQQVMPSFAGRILPVDEEIARCCARLHIPDRKSERDALIAATAIERGMTVVTRNVRDFRPTGAAVLNPWDTSR